MKQFTVYDKEGFVIRWGECHENDFLLQASKDEKVVEGHVDQHLKRTLPIIDVKESDREAIVLGKMNEILRQMAINELKKEGKI